MLRNLPVTTGSLWLAHRNLHKFIRSLIGKQTRYLSSSICCLKNTIVLAVTVIEHFWKPILLIDIRDSVFRSRKKEKTSFCIVQQTVGITCQSSSTTCHSLRLPGRECRERFAWLNKVLTIVTDRLDWGMNYKICRL